jgi:chromosome segregation ATPase
MSGREGTGRGARQKARPTRATAFQRLQERGEQILSWVPELRKTLLPEGEQQGLEALLTQIENLRGRMKSRAQETSRDLEARAERLLGDLEQQAVKRLGPLLTRANVLSRTDLEPIEDRMAHVEERLGTLLDDRANLTTRVLDLERRLEEAQADASERMREATLALSTGDEMQGAIATVHSHLDALSKEQVSRNLEFGKLHDRLVRLEMRLGDLLKEHGARQAEQEETKHRLAALDTTLVAEREETRGRLSALNATLEDAVGTLRSTAEQAAAAAVATRDTAGRLDTLRDERTGDRRELFQIEHRIGDVERTLRQVELRLGDLTERQSAGREEIASLAARVSQLELAAARPATAPALPGHTEGH